MFAKSKDANYEVNVNEEHQNWITISIKNIQVKNNEIEIGFLADGKADSFCLVDDVTLVVNK